MATPSIPPRPTRSQNSNPSSGNTMEVPRIPPRPTKRSVDRSVSPGGRDSYARSPLNDPSYLHNGQHHKESHLSTEVPARPPSVSLPSIGQEGNEYASVSFDDLSKTLTNEKENSPQQTKNVAGDLPLYAPKASVPSSTAKSRIQTVTRTDSNQAVAAGVGSLAPEDKSATAGESGRSDSSAGNRTRPGSMYKDEEEHGIPEIGVQVPMYPNAGDVQAPTPSPYDSGTPATGIGFFNKPGGSRHHARTKSGREIFHGPPGSYGRHGHGVIPKDDFEQKWYEKHPEDKKREKAGEYGPHIQVNRKDYHWMGDDLVKLVHSSGSKGVGLGTSRDAVGTPDEHIGYRASEEFASRMASPRPASGRPASISSKSGVKIESPLHHVDGPSEELSKQKTNESESEDVIHIDPPSHPSSKIHGGGYDPPTEDLRAHGGNTEEKGGWITERGHGHPILASDEIQKYPGAEYREPAVDPERRRSDEYNNENEAQHGYLSKQRTHSRSSSRNSNLHSGKQLNRITSPTEHDRSGTPLESHKEYEPLFPEDEEDEHKKPKVTDKRPHLAPRHHFPSQDVWEDSPSSHHLETTVETPQAPEEPQEQEEDVPASKVFEKPESEEVRKDTITKEDQESFLPEHTKRFANKHLKNVDLPTRPGMQQRFPSHDIWEDAPDHGQLVTTVSGPQSEDTNEYAEDSPVAEKSSASARPSVPARPQKPKELSPVDKKAPILPDRPKPQVPARPTKTISSDKVPTVDSQGDTAPQPKAKPQVPARPAGNKIAALQAGFLKDLNSKLGLGPQAPKVKEPELEKEEEPPKPLQDARKGRAKGPQRRKPQSSPSPAAAAAGASERGLSKANFQISSISTLWTIGDNGDVDVPAARMAAKIQEVLQPKKEEAVESSQEVSAQAETRFEPESSVDVPEALEKDTPGSFEEEDAGKPEQTELTQTISRESAKPIDETPALDATGGIPLDSEAGPHVTLPGSVAEPEATEPPQAAEPVKSSAPLLSEPITQESVADERNIASAEGEAQEVGQDPKVAT